MSRGTLAALVAGMATVCVVVWPPYLATLDGPQYIYIAYIFKSWPSLADWYKPSVPMGSVGFPFLFLPLTLLLPWMIAYRIALGLTAMLWCGASIALAKALHPGRTFVAVLSSTLLLGWALAMGFLSFLVGSAIAGWALAAALDGEPARKSVAIKTQLLLSLAVLAHLFTGALGIGAVAFVCLCMEGTIRDKIARLSSRIAVPAMLTLVLVVITRQKVLPGGESSYLEASDRFLSVSKMGFGGPLWRALPPTLIASFAAVRCLLQAKKEHGDRREWGLAIMVLGCLVLAMFAPLHLPGWMHVGPRFVPFALLLGISLVPFERLHKEHATIAASVISTFSLAAVVWFGDYFRNLSAAVEPLLAVTRAPIRGAGPRLPVLSADPWFAGIGTMDANFPFADPAFNIPLLAAVEQGGIVPYTFTTARFIHPYVDRPDHPPFPVIPPRERFWLGLVDPEVHNKPNLRHALLVDVASHASRFEDMMLFGPPEDQKILDYLGFESKWRSDAGYIGSFKGCPVTLGIKAPENAPAKLVASYGWFPLVKPIWSAPITRNETLTKIALPGAPCGPIWVQVESEEAPIMCTGALPDGRLVAFDRTNQKGLVCALISPAH